MTGELLRLSGLVSPLPVSPRNRLLVPRTKPGWAGCYVQRFTLPLRRPRRAPERNSCPFLWLDKEQRLLAAGGLPRYPS